ncbi:MAG: hypothetical protein GQ564_19770 [Bacteroidales bacterium]|nr:hypothetical protein [Bacteroidales bacterium]
MKDLQINKTSKEKIVESLELIAKELILNRLIIVNKSKFSLIDIELYYWHNFHKDDYAKGIKHTRPFGDFELHRYGIDISLGNAKNNDFGGILIRGLYDIDKKEVLSKSKVVKSLFNQLVQGNNHFELVKEKTPWKSTFNSKRLNLGQSDNPNKSEYFNMPYKYLAKDPKLFETYPDKEIILRDSNLNESEIKSLLGYNLSK